MLPRSAYVKTVRRPYPPLYWSLVLGGSSVYAHYLPFIHERFAIRDQLISDSVAYYSQREKIRAGTLAFNNWKNKRGLERAQKNFQRLERQLLSATRQNFQTYCDVFE